LIIAVGSQPDDLSWITMNTFVSQFKLQYCPKIPTFYVGTYEFSNEARYVTLKPIRQDVKSWLLVGNTAVESERQNQFSSIQKCEKNTLTWIFYASA